MRPWWSGYITRGTGDRNTRWVEALGGASTESLPKRLTRHAASYRAWMDFIFRTLLRRG